MIVANRDMILNGQRVVAGQVLDGLWPALRELARRNLLRQRWVLTVSSTEPTSTGVPSTEQPSTTRKRGRPKGSKNKPKPVAQDS